MSIRNPSITYLITSIGKPTLKDTLRSLHGQFASGLDKVHLYFDGPCTNDSSQFQEEIDMYGSDIQVVTLETNLGYWGHGIRNKYQTMCPTDYVHNMDDDDIYVNSCIPNVRNELRTSYGKVVICKFRTLGSRIIWSKPKLIFGEVGTPSGFIFNRPEVFGTWGLQYGGDFQFYEQIQDNIGKENLVFKDILVVKTRPEEYGY